MQGIRDEKHTTRIKLSAAQLHKRKPHKLLARQNYCAYAVVTAEKNNGKAALYILGTFAHLEEAQVYVKEIHDRGFNNFDILISDTYEWLPFPPEVSQSNPELKYEHMQPIMRDIMSGHKRLNNSAADMIEERANDIKEKQAEVKLRVKCQRFFNRVVAEVLDVVPIVPSTCIGVGTGPPMKDLLRQRAEDELKRLEEEAKAEFEDEVKRLKGLKETKFSTRLKALFTKRTHDARFEMEDLERKEAAMEEEEAKKTREKKREAEKQAAAREREAQKSVMIQNLKEQANKAREAASEAIVATKATPKPAVEMTLSEVIDESVPIADASLDGGSNRNRRRRKRRQEARRKQRAAQLEHAATMEGLDAKTRYNLLVERLKAEVAEFDPDAGLAMTAEQEALDRELRMQNLLQELDRERLNAHQEMKQESGDAEKEKDYTPEERKEMLRLAMLKAKAERINAQLTPEQQERLKVLQERREAIDRRKARVEKRKKVGGDAILNDMGVKIGRSTHHRPKGLQN